MQVLFLFKPLISVGHRDSSAHSNSVIAVAELLAVLFASEHRAVIRASHHTRPPTEDVRNATRDLSTGVHFRRSVVVTRTGAVRPLADHHAHDAVPYIQYNIIIIVRRRTRLRQCNRTNRGDDRSRIVSVYPTLKRCCRLPVSAISHSCSSIHRNTTYRRPRANPSARPLCLTRMFVNRLVWVFLSTKHLHFIRSRTPDERPFCICIVIPI